MSTASEAVTPEEIEKRKRLLAFRLGSTIPEMLQSVDLAAKKGCKIAIRHDAFAYEYDDREYILLGMWIKYAAGLKGVDVMIVHEEKPDKSKSK